MGELFRSAGQRETDPPDSLNMFFAGIGLSLFGCSFQYSSRIAAPNYGFEVIQLAI